MVMTQSHKDAIKKGVQSYHACAKSHGCGKGNKAKAKKPVKKEVKKEVKKVVKKPVKKAVKKSPSPEIFKDNIKSPTPKKKLTEAEIQKLEMEDLEKKVKTNYLINQATAEAKKKPVKKAVKKPVKKADSPDLDEEQKKLDKLIDESNNAKFKSQWKGQAKDNKVFNVKLKNNKVTFTWRMRGTDVPVNASYTFQLKKK